MSGEGGGASARKGGGLGAGKGAGGRAVALAFLAMGAAASSRDRGVALGLFALPVLVLSIVGVAMKGYTRPEMTVGLHVEGVPSEGAPVRLLRARLDADAHLRVRDYSDAERMRISVYRGRLQGGISLPADWPGGEGELAVYASQAGAGTPTLRLMLDQVLAELAAEDASARPRIQVLDGDTLGSPPIGYQFTAPSNLVVFVMVSAIMAAAGTVALRRTGLGSRLLAAPVSRGWLSLGLALPLLQLIAVQSLFLLGIGWLAFDVDWGDPLGLTMLTGALALVGAGLSLCLGTLFRSESQVVAVGPFLAMAMGMAGGCMWPLEMVPEGVARFGHLFPTAWAMDGYLTLVFGGGGWRDVAGEAGVLLAMAVGLAAIGTLRLQRQLSGR